MEKDRGTRFHGEPSVFILDEPHYHRVRLGEVHRFRGLVLAPEGPAAEAVAVYRDGEALCEAAADLPSPALAGLLRQPRAANCRFEFDLRIEEGAPCEIRVRRAGGGEEPVFLFDLPRLEREGPRFARLWEEVRRRPAPSSDLVARTQGGGNVDAYRDSVVSGLTTAEALLRRAGAEPDALTSILDIGCGTGRLLLAWRTADPRHRLVGVDIQEELIAWNREHLPDVADWCVGPLAPPLGLPAGSFDLIQLVSVLTHLPLDLQRAWVAEVRRLLRPGGHALVTLHGTVYAALLLDAERRAAFGETGYLEVPGGPAGSNPFATFHAPDFARELFRDFRVHHLPRGQAAGETPRLFPLASLQDVYILTAPS
jgi:SAM-dependent methyltransferase